MSNQNNDKFNLLIKQHELTQKVASDLKNVLEKCEIVLLCDDSSSMNAQISEEGADPFAQKKSTRWFELKKLTAALIEIITAVNTDGLDLYFLNRSTQKNVNSLTGLSNIFSIEPNGDTRITSKLNQIYKEKYTGKQLLIVVITDGEPNDGTSRARSNLFYAIQNITSNGNVHVSFAECTDQEEDMEYLDGWDNKLQNFDNTDDYREELRRVKQKNGQNFKFDYTDYVIKILLATFIKSYFNIDQINGNQTNNNNNYDGCCNVL